MPIPPPLYPRDRDISCQPAGRNDTLECVRRCPNGRHHEVPPVDRARDSQEERLEGYQEGQGAAEAGVGGEGQVEEEENEGEEGVEEQEDTG